MHKISPGHPQRNCIDPWAQPILGEADNIPKKEVGIQAMFGAVKLRRGSLMIDKHGHATSTGAQGAPVDVVALQKLAAD
jgi:hypothetical protein